MDHSSAKEVGLASEAIGHVSTCKQTYTIIDHINRVVGLFTDIIFVDAKKTTKKCDVFIIILNKMLEKEKYKYHNIGSLPCRASNIDNLTKPPSPSRTVNMMHLCSFSVEISYCSYNYK